jgi:hypothetical protein
MRAPSQSFRAEIAAYRKVLVAQNIVDSDKQLALKVLDNWSRDPDVETLWEDLIKNLGLDAIPTPGHLIDLVIERRLIAADLENFEIEATDVEVKARSRIKRDLQDQKYDELALRSATLHNVAEGRKRVLGRQKGGFRRRYFIVGWSDKFQELCGSPLDEAVATITRIAFGNHGRATHADGKKHAFMHEVRDARRLAWGTKGGDTRRPK